MISDARGGHVSPGIYTEERDVAYSVKSLGITSLGLVGETLYGPAFENIEIENWGEFVDYFGGTSTEKFKGTGLPKYELPYIAKSYLEESKRLNVVRVLGLSGYHAGDAWVLSSVSSGAPVVILRSKMVYGYNDQSMCEPVDPDKPAAIVNLIQYSAYTEVAYDSACVPTETPSTSGVSKDKFSLVITTNGVGGFESGGVYTYNVSLNPADNDYIYKVFGSKPTEGNAPVYIEAVYENSWDGNEISCVDHVSKANVARTEFFELVSGVTSGAGTTWEYKPCAFDESKVFTSVSATSILVTESGTSIPTGIAGGVYVVDTFLNSGNNKNIKIVRTEEKPVYDDFTEMYRPAQTPWIVSEVSARQSAATLTKLFKFVTISDGEAANYQVKVSIQNINPFEGTFDVVVRDFYDDDAAPIVLEKFSRCNLVEGDSNYIAFKIGTTDGGYASKSKYILVEMASDEDLSNHVPAGFLGFPMPDYTNEENGISRQRFEMKYYDLLDATKKPRRQYFGLNSKVLDADVLAYKGKYFYDNAGDANPANICNGFHLDSILSKYKTSEVYVDGVSGYWFTPVSVNKVGAEKSIPRIINTSYIYDTIYKDATARKFTTYFYGGFDGWDLHRTSRTNTDRYKASRYNVEGSTAFSHVSENGLNASLNLPVTAITTDYYAYLAGFRRFANPQDVDINLFATPGIDWYNNTLLTEDAIDMIEDSEDGRGGDALYIMASPKEIDTIDDLALQFADLEIDTSYAATYYPWVMYYDASNKRYLDLPVTKDVVRNMAATDNNAYPWFAPAGTQRGVVNCVKALYKTTLADEDVLYEGRINPVKSFAQDGVKIWGNKTAYSIDSPLNRINVRRLMIRIKKLVSEAAKHLIFEQYDDTLEKQFKGIVEPILADVKANRGLYDYRVITEVTEETRDQHILPAKILVKPTPALEYISISFVVYPESVSFEEN